MNSKKRDFVKNATFFILLFCSQIFFTIKSELSGKYLDEYIELFDSQIFVNKNATLQVEETIVYVNNGKRARGIYRDFPTVYNYGIFTDVANFKLLKVECNGKKENFKQEKISGGYRIYIGKEDVFLKSGKYEYKIEYTVDKVLGYYNDHDELYWDVNGTGWRMPIEKVSASVFLPKGLKISLDGYTGFKGQKGKDFVSKIQEGVLQKGSMVLEKESSQEKLAENKRLEQGSLVGDKNFSIFSIVRFETTRSLHPGENITIVVGWPKGFIIVPSGLTWFYEFLKDNLLLILSILLFIIFLFYSIISYIRHRKAQSIETVIPLFYPPKDLCPADVRYISKMSYDVKAFAAEIVNMAVHGLIKIKYEKKFFSGVYTLIKNSSGDQDLFVRQEAVGQRGLESDGASGNGQPEKEQGSDKNCLLKYGYILDMLFAKRSFFDFGSGQQENEVTLDDKRNQNIKRASDSLQKTLSEKFAKHFLIKGVYIAAYVLSLIFIFAAYAFNENILQIFIGATFAIIFGFFIYLLLGYTPEGLKIKAQIDGFKMFLETTEEERLKIIGTPPTKTPQLYEKYLPYAIALGVEQQWSKKFAPVFESLIREGTPYVPLWYFGYGPIFSFDSNAFASDLSKVATDISKSLSQNSGLGGGGSSGGGRGGGGGGSW